MPSRVVAYLAAMVRHFVHDGAAVAAAWALLPLREAIRRRRADPGERAAARYLQALGYTVVARNWRSPRDPRDEADLIACTPCGREVAIVEVKRARGPWNALDRIDRRKREVLWRLLLDLERAQRHGGGDLSSRRLSVALARAARVRVDAIGVRGEGRSAAVYRHEVGLFVRRLRAPPDTTGYGLEKRTL